MCSRGLDQSLQALKLDLELRELHLEFLSSSCQMWLSPNCVVLLLLLLCHLATLLALQAVARVQPVQGRLEMPVRSALGHEALRRLSMFERRPVFAGRDPGVLLEEAAEMRGALEAK